MPKRPEPILTPQDAAWGRAVNASFDELERSLSMLDSEQTAGSKGAAATLARLSEQVMDLQGRIGYSADGTGTSATWNTSTAVPYAWGPSLVFTLTEERMVSIQSIIAGSVYALAQSATSSAFAFLRSAIFINGALATGARGQMGTNVGVLPNTGRSSMYDGQITSRSLLRLPAGTHTVQGGFTERTAEVNGSPPVGNATVTASNPFLFIDVLQPAGA